eukprot:gb/GECG01001129.1/.p1 GENE.gb/GECG01001129.1/~~gb/GECG01001129.1/.p1  ORF type:complete len:317 (+),score=53.02 gb/GECG01001129.1/:1-951(+)
MCGRSRCTLNPEDVRRVFGDVPQSRWKNASRYSKKNNCHPGNHTPVAYEAKDGDRAIMTAKWGLIPSFHKRGDKLDSFRLMNARAESVNQKPIYKRLVNRRRCVIVFDGFFEWQKDEKGEKQPYYIYRKDGKPIMLAGLWDCFHDSDESKDQLQEEENKVGGESGEEDIYSYTILTMAASPALSWLHHRMPVLLNNEEQVNAWLDHSMKFQDICSSDNKKVSQAFTPVDTGEMTYHPVSKKMNRISYDSEDVTEPIELKKDTDKDEGKSKITSFFHRKPQKHSENDAGNIAAPISPGEKRGSQQTINEPTAKARKG